MATESTPATVNGMYGGHQAYSLPEQASAPSGPRSSDTPGTSEGYGNEASIKQGATPDASATEKQEKKPSKDEVGWFFVEQYYTTLSKSPEKLLLFYAKQSQFLSGVEAEKVPVSIGQRAIGERIKEMDIQDCKIRVTNVDSQDSYDNIVVQVIGEMSLKAAPHRKFTQTFVLAKQPNGYFVLNDIFRYLIEEEDDSQEAAAEPGFNPEQPVEAELAPLTPTENPADQRNDITQVERKLEEVPSAPSQFPEDISNGTSSPDAVVVAEDAPAAAVSSQGEAEGFVTDNSVVEAISSDETQAEKPRDLGSTPIASPPPPVKTTTSPLAQPSKPTAPRTWATLVANSQGNTPAAASTPAPSASQQAPSQSRAASFTQSTSSPSVPLPSETRKPPPPSNGNAVGWQTQEGGKRQGRQQSTSGNNLFANHKDTVLGYVKNVNEKVDASLLKQTLSSFGKLAYFDVSRQKNCAFIEFENPEGYNAAVAQNPHNIGGELVFVEERRPRPNAYGGGFNSNRGAGGQRGARGGGAVSNENARSGSGGQKGGYDQGRGRGGFTPRGRGGGMRGGQGQRGGSVAT